MSPAEHLDVGLTVERVFLALRARAARRHRGLRSLRILRCPEADAEHAARERQYMHYGHRPRTICYAAASEGLDLENKVGVLAHEIGHAFADLTGILHSEADANRFGSTLCDCVVRFSGESRLERAEVPGWLRMELA